MEGNVVIKRNLPTLILIIILLLASSFRLCGIGSESYWLDEIASVRQAQVQLDESIELVSNDITLPFYIVLLNGWVHLFGISELATRTLSAVFGIMTVFAVYLIGRRWYGLRVGIFASLLMALSPIQIFYSQEARMYSLMVLLAALSFYMFMEVIKRPLLYRIIIYILINIMLIYTHLFGFLVLLVQSVCYLIFMRAKTKNMVYGTIVALIILASFVPWVPILARQIANTAYYGWITKPDISSLIQLLQGYLGGTFVLLLFGSSIVLTGNKVKEMQTKLLYAWAFMPIILVFTYSILFRPLFEPRYLLFSAPAMILLLSANLSKLRFYARWKDLLMVGLAVLLIVPAVGQAIRTDKDDMRNLAMFLEENVDSDEFVLIHPPYYEDPLIYYYGNDCFSERWVYSCANTRYNILSIDYNETCCGAETKLNVPGGKNLLGDYDKTPIWLVEIREDVVDEDNNMLRYVNKTKKLTGNYSIGDIRIYHFT